VSVSLSGSREKTVMISLVQILDGVQLILIFNSFNEHININIVVDIMLIKLNLFEAIVSTTIQGIDLAFLDLLF